MERRIRDKVQGYETQDGAGVKLVRVLSRRTVDEYDPILMLDSFDSKNLEDYTKGFPLHPHRGIETISLLVKGSMVHKDSLGNEDRIDDGEVQWMTAGSGILHEEMIPEREEVLGVQLWLNLPKKDKMVKPEYHSLKKDQIEEIEIENGSLRLIGGQYKNHQGFMGKYSPLDYYHIRLDKDSEFRIDTEKNKSVMVFTLKGDCIVSGEKIDEKTAVKFEEGDFIKIKSLDEDIDILFMSSERLDEPVAWGGPIVMNTDEELRQAFVDLETGKFLKDSLEY